jgi:hypothetical protein
MADPYSYKGPMSIPKAASKPKAQTLPSAVGPSRGGPTVKVPKTYNEAGAFKPGGNAPAAAGAPVNAGPLPPVGQVVKNPTFDLARKRAEQGLASSGQIQNDAIQRRFAAQGGLNSGAFVKAQEGARESAASQRQNAMEGIDAAEAADTARQQEILSGREFSRSERIGSQDFSRLERLDTQQFSAAEAVKLRQFEGFYRDQDLDFKNRSLDIDTRLKERGLDQADQANAISGAGELVNLAGVEDLSPELRAQVENIIRKNSKGTG